MKKGLLFVAVIAASLASCKKDRICTCTTTASGFTGTPNETTYTKSTKAAASANCLSSTEVDNGVTYTTTCELK
jgi:hypothetical protein